jgi:hypothetical protein
MASAAAVEDPFSGAAIAFIFTDVIFKIVVLVIGGAHNVIWRLVGYNESSVLLFVVVLVPFPGVMAFFGSMAFPFAVVADKGFNG